MFKLLFKYKILFAILFLVLYTSLLYSNVYFLVVFSLLSYLILPIRKYWDGVAFMLVLFSCFYSLVSILTNRVPSGFLLLSYLFAPVSFYRMGRWFMSYFYEDRTRQKLLLTIIISYLLPLFIITCQDIARVGIVNVSRAMSSSDSGDMVATLYGLMASVGIGGISCLFIKGLNRLLRLGYVLLSIFSLIVVIHLVNRSGLIVFVVCALLSFLISKKMSVQKVILLFVLLIGVTISFSDNLALTGDVLEAYQQREMDSSHNTVEIGGRMGLWSEAFRNLVSNPFGWELVRYAHNLWLDIARVGGWMPLFFFLIATIMWFKDLATIAIKKTTPFMLIVLLFNMAMFLSSLVEPVIDGSMLFFSLFMMMWGITASLAKE